MSSARLSRRSFAALATSTLVLGGAVLTAPPASADKGSGGGGNGGGGNDNSPPFDFTDAFYRANGVDPTGLAGRPTGSDPISVVAPAPDANHRNVRSKLTLPGYDLSGKRWYFTVLADLTATGFTADAAGTAARQLAEASPVYVFPTRTGDPLGVGNSRQADMLDMSHGYFSNNPLGLWVHIFVTWTPAAFNTSGGQKALADLSRKNGTALDGTPMILSFSDLDKLTKNGYVAQNKRPVGATGRYFVCPVIKDPRRGGIAADAFLAVPRDSSGNPAGPERIFVTEFESLRTTGDYPR